MDYAANERRARHASHATDTALGARSSLLAALALALAGLGSGAAQAQAIVSTTRTVQANADIHTMTDVGLWSSSAGSGLTTASQVSDVSGTSIFAQGAANAHWPSSNSSKSTVDVTFTMFGTGSYSLTGDIFADISGFSLHVPGTCSVTLTGPGGVVASYAVVTGGPEFSYTLNSSGSLAAGTYTLSINGAASGFGSSQMNGADGAANYNVLLTLAGPCGAPGAGYCGLSHGNPGCSDVSCCVDVCGIDPFCCQVQWDQICANEATGMCTLPPLNDDCAFAAPIGVGSTPFSTELASGAIEIPASCDEGYGTTIFDDIYFTYVAEGTGVVTVSTCGGSTFDTRLAAFTGPCSAPVWVACNDDSVGCPDYTSKMSFNAICGESFTIVVGSFNATSGTATLTIEQQGYCNGDCASAAEIFDGNTEVSNLGGTATVELPASCNEGYGTLLTNAVYYRHVATATGPLTISTCDGVAFDARLAVFSGPCGNPQWLGCNDDACRFSGPAEVTIDVTCGTEYTIVFGGYDGSVGSGTMTLTQLGVCNDDCAHAIDIPDGTVPVTNVGATNGVQLPPFCEEGYGTLLTGAVYFRHVATASGPLKISTCGGVSFDARLAVFTGACNDPQWLGCNDDACASSGPAEVTINATCGTEYIIILGGYNGAEGSGTMTLTQQGTCGPICPGDIDHSGAVDASDLAILLGQWATAGADLTGDGTTDASDLAVLLGAWGPCT